MKEQDDMSRSVGILDCTLRDGSYVIDFQFTAEDTRLICSALEDAGLEMIEVGHGVGMGGSDAGCGLAAATDEEYVSAAASVLTKAKFGTFFIPGIGTKEHLDMARDYGMSFVRIGTNITQSDEASEYIGYAKKLGFEVSYNAMKSYVVSPEEFLERAQRAIDAGADVIYLVDSAGGMLPNEVKQYIELLREKLTARIGFHGHNNFMLANANNLAALEAGATMLDSTVQGMGRSSGNAQTEIMVLLYEKLGIETGVDIVKLMNVGENLIRPRMRTASGVCALDMTMAQAQFHSSFLERIERATAIYDVDPKVLIIEVSKIDRVNPSEKMIQEIAAQLAELKTASVGQ
ncbi:MAG TPA: 4-hydroxy-2-oxovalerate aldolase [Pyrinomonadaceae bacterium]|nr:4-hydroxy-2-oxovalerate aldolase [Pyrinomonadaceae bacterium]